jgi:hypothetical protein
MSKLNDKAEIRRRLNLDREWSLYALADLDDGLFEHCDWLGYGDAWPWYSTRWPSGRSS